MDTWARFCPLVRYLNPLDLYRDLLQRTPQADEVTTSAATDATGEEAQRVIFVNHPQPVKYVNNRISTGKYSLATFVPLFLFEQFRRYSNCFFLLIALLQQLPDVSPTGRWTTLLPLLLILAVSALKEIVEDYKRYRADDETNNRRVAALRGGEWAPVRWRDLVVGDICQVQDNQFFPADLVLLSSSEPAGISFIETSNLDGETNLKIRQALPGTAARAEPAALRLLDAVVRCDAPNRHLYEFNGSFKEALGKPVPLRLEQMLLRGAMLRNTSRVAGLVVYTGHDTKLMRNSAGAPLKRSSIDKQTNTQILMLFIVLLALSLLSAVCSEVWGSERGDRHWYLSLKDLPNKNFGLNFLTFLILYNNLIPISLQVTAEIVRFFQAKFISMDLAMYDAESDTAAAARTSNLNEELGMVRYVFSDKTGTLTQNVMQFHRCSVGGVIYDRRLPSQPLEETRVHRDLAAGGARAALLDEFLMMLTLCHTVIPETSGGRIEYHAASPDERALVQGAAALGYALQARTPARVSVRVGPGEGPGEGRARGAAVLHVLEFTSVRRRMSVIVRTDDDKIILYCKGADAALFPRLAGAGGAEGAGGAGADAAAALAHLEVFAAEGLRTLVCAAADLDEQTYETFSEMYARASESPLERETLMAAAEDYVERDMRLLGATAIEDKLQDGVPETISSLLKANIVIWVLTGDKQETAINIAHSARLIQPDMPLILLNEDSLDATRESIARRAAEFGESLGRQSPVALVVDGQTLKYAAGCDLAADFMQLCLSCQVVLCCRVAPMQKAEVVEMVGAKTGAVTLAIGDGANDVAMIRRASVGVGVSGREGLQAVCAADYSIAQFRFLARLLLVHGAWNYSRISKLILYCFYKNICLYVIELWFAIYSAWSGQIIFERWTIGFYNVIFTALPPFAIGLFDKICSADVMMRYPALYLPSQRGLLFNVRVFWVWALNALLHSVLLYWLPAALDGSSRPAGYLLLGNTIYTYVVLTVCLKAGLATASWTWLTHVSIWGSVVMWILFVLVYSNIYPHVDVGAVMLGADRMMLGSPAFWLGLALVPLAALLPDLMATAVHNTAFKSVTEAVRESEIRHRDPDDVMPPRHTRSVSETARLLQHVRGAFRRQPSRAADLEMSHGFAFSQEEGGTVSHFDVIRAYHEREETRAKPEA